MLRLKSQCNTYAIRVIFRILTQHRSSHSRMFWEPHLHKIEFQPQPQLKLDIKYWIWSSITFFIFDPLTHVHSHQKILTRPASALFSQHAASSCSRFQYRTFISGPDLNTILIFPKTTYFLWNHESESEFYSHKLANPNPNPNLTFQNGRIRIRIRILLFKFVESESESESYFSNLSNPNPNPNLDFQNYRIRIRIRI